MNKIHNILNTAIICVASLAGTAHGEIVGIWTNSAELASIPTQGCGWERVKQGADQADPTSATLSDQDSNNNARILAAAIVYARTGASAYRNKVVAAVQRLVSQGKPDGRTLAWAREAGAYVMAADLVDYQSAAFDDWLIDLAENWRADDNRTLLKMFRQRPNNWGSHAFASLSAIYAYLGDSTMLEEIYTYWTQMVNGPTPKYVRYGSDKSWHVDTENPHLINPAGSVKQGMNIDGLVPDDMRRGDSFHTEPDPTGYPWEFLQGVIVAARIMERMDMPIWQVGDRAIYRAAAALQVRMEHEFGGWQASGDDEWLLPFLDDAYGTDWRSAYDSCDSRVYKHGKNAGWGWILGIGS